MAQGGEQFELILGNRQLLSMLFLTLLLVGLIGLFGYRIGLNGVKSGESSPPNGLPLDSKEDSFSRQIAALDSAKTALQSLTVYVDQQKNELEVSRNELTALQDQAKRIEPLVAADRKIVDSLFTEQEQRNQAAQFRERWIGFVLGVAASLFATAISTVAFWRKKAA